MATLKECILKLAPTDGHVHITLVGGQAAPVYHGIVATNPDIVEVIYSEQSAPVFEQIKKEVHVHIKDSAPLSPTNPDKIVKRAEMLAEKYKNSNKITLNISGGPKSWSHLFGMVFQNKENAAVVYMDQNNILWNYKTMTAKRDFAFDMRTQFRLYGNPLEKYKQFSLYTEEDYKVCKEIETLRKMFPNEFNSLFIITDNATKNKVSANKGTHTHGESYVEWDKSERQTLGTTTAHIFLKSKKYEKEITLTSPHAYYMLFDAGWFEYKVAEIFSRWDKAKEIVLNCSFPAKNNVDKNEVDIIINAGTKIIFVECKTQISKITDIDKFRSVVKGYGGMGSKGIFVTDAVKTVHAKEKCQQNGLIDIDLSDGFNETDFYKLLDKELGQLNTK